MPLISIIMPVYNESLNEIRESINSILDQTYTDFEYIIIDDNPENTKIRKYIENRSKRDNRIRVTINPCNLKLVKSENKGIKLANGKYIARMDADDISKPNRLNNQLKFLIKHNLDVVCSNCSLINNYGRVIKHHFFSNVTQYNQNKIKHAMSYCDIANGPTLFFKKKVFNDINGYRVSFIDDYDFVSRALIRGFKVGYQANDVIVKRHRDTSISNKNILKQFNGVYVLSKFLRKTKFRRVIPFKYLKQAFDNITPEENIQFSKFIRYRNNFKLNRSINDLIKALSIIFSSEIMFRRFIWIHLVAKRQDSLLR